MTRNGETDWRCELPSDPSSTLEVIDLHIGKPLHPAKLTPAPDSSDVPHTVIAVKRPSADEIWILDVTGRQYGFADVLVPYARYWEEKQCRSTVGYPSDYSNWTETRDLDYYTMMPFWRQTRLLKLDADVERKGRLHFVKFVRESVADDILKGLAAVFEEKRRAVEAALRSHMRTLRV